MSEDWDLDLGNTSTPPPYTIPTTADRQNNNMTTSKPSEFQGGISVGKGRGFNNLRQAFSQVGISKPSYSNGTISNESPGQFDNANTRSYSTSGDGGWEEEDNSYGNSSSSHWQEDGANGNRGGGRSNGSAFGSRSGKGCFNCGKEGHMGRDCPDKNGGHRKRRNDSRGGGNKGCFKCGEDGHMSRDCPNGGDSGQRGGKGCYKCGEDGHMARDCPSAGDDSRKSSRGCFKCGEDGHMSRDCPNAGDSSQRSGGKGCFKCGEDGHMAKDCPSAAGSGDKGRGCFRCGEEGHMAKDCTNEDKRVDADGKPREAPYIPPEPSQDESTLFEGVPTGINFTKYDSIPVTVSGRGAPSPISSFEEAQFRDLLNRNIKRSKYDKPTPVQKHAIPIILAKRDLMACAQTGSGKTAAFLLPILQSMFNDPDLPNPAFKSCQEPLAIVISPTRELAIQIFNEARKFAYDSIVKIELLYGGTSVSHQSQRLQKGCHVLVATPGRLQDFVEKSKVSFSQLRYLVLDEADRMLDMGFIPAVRSVVTHSTMTAKGERQTLMFSATFPEEIQHLAAEFLNDYLFLAVGIVGAANTDVQQRFHLVEQFEKRSKLIDILNSLGKTDRTLVFVESKRTADFIASFLSQNNFPATSIHGDRLQREREEALFDFRRGKMPILVATAVAARGLDIKDVRNVVNFDLPSSIDEYVHRIGRTGRVGNIGQAISFYDTAKDKPLAKALLKILGEARQEVPSWLEEEANSSYDSTGFSHSGGPYGARDIRKNRFNAGSGRSDSVPSWEPEVSATNDYSSPVVAEESWD